MGNNKQLILNQQRIDAKHGEFFFVEFFANNNKPRQSPVLVISEKDNDNEDVIVCSCTKSPARSDFDILVNLKLPTHVRTNKIYTIRREQLLFKIPQTATPTEYLKIINKLKESIHINNPT